MNDLIKKEIEDYLVKFPGCVCSLKQHFKNHKKEMYDFIMNYTSILDNKYSFTHRLYWVINKITNFPKCKLCGQPNKRVIKKFDDGYNGTLKYCSHKCCVNSEHCLSKRVETNIERYGTKTPCENKEILDKCKKTNIERYGVDNTFKVKSVQDKCKKTNIERYGVDKYCKSDEFKQQLSNIWKNRTQKQKNDIIKKSSETKQEKYNDPNYNNRKKYVDTMISKYGVEVPIRVLEIKDKIIKTNLEKYGSSFVIQNPLIQQKVKDTNLERYGCIYPIQNDLIKQKVRDTNLERYGKDYYSKTKECKNRVIKTNLVKYGVKYPLSNKDIYKKSIETQLKKYGCLYSQTDEFKNKLIEFNRSKYGVDWGLQSNVIKQKSKNTLIQKYGVDSYFKTDLSKYKNQVKKLTQTYNRMCCSSLTKPLFSLQDFIRDPYSSKHKWKCLKCGDIFEAYKDRNKKIEDSYVRCYKCYPSKCKSVAEIDIFNCIKNICPDSINGCKTIINPKELDIYIPSKKIAIEFDGLYWHNNEHLNYDKKYHLNKTQLCESKGIQLIHVFEDEYEFKKDIVLSRIKNIVGVYDKTIYARKCEIRNVNNNDKNDFLKGNHIQGTCNSKYNYGLYYNNELISLMTFGNLRKALGQTSKENEYELLRFCNKLNYHIPGAASKLFKHFINEYNPNRVISYADRRWSKGNLYEKLGFNFIKTTDPNYWYIINNHREHRFGWRKDVLKDKLRTFDSSKTEYQNMLDNNIDCIYDCGNLLYEWIKN